MPVERARERELGHLRARSRTERGLLEKRYNQQMCKGNLF